MHANPLAIFLTQAFVIVAVSRLFGLATARARQPLVIAEIIAGIALGPSLLGAVAPSVEATLFPPASLGALSITSQVGVVLFMFLVGIKLDPALLRGRTRAAVAISHASIVVPFVLGGVLGVVYAARLSPPHVPWLSFVLFMGVAMSITAFPVLARILLERNMMRSNLGALALSCAAVDDVTAWCVLACIVSIARAAGLSDSMQTIALALIYIAVMLWGVRPMLARLARRTGGALSQGQFVIVMLLVLASAWTTERIGIHALFGAFLLGSILPRDGAHAQKLIAALTERLEDLVSGLLLPLFFAYSGLRTQIGLIDTPEDAAICGVIIAAAIAGKFGGGTVAARLTGLRWREASVIGVLMNTRGLMELIVLNIGLDLGVISPRLFTMMVLMALVTTFVTAPLLAWLEPRNHLSSIETSEPRKRAL